jgi:acyl-CoA dehydrogenase
VCRSARVALSSAYEYATRREAFGKTIMDQPVVRHRLGKAGVQLESLWSWLEMFCYQMSKMKKIDADRELGGLTAMAKAQAGIVLNECAQTAVLIFGGNGITADGQGALVQS